MFSFYPYYLRNQRGGEGYSRFQGFFGFDICLRLFGVEKFGKHFFGFYLSREVLGGIQNNLKVQMVWWINKHKHSVCNVLIFCFISFKAFHEFLRLRNSAWDFWGVNFWFRVFGGFVGSHRDFFGYWFLPPFGHPYHLKSGEPPGGSGAHIGALVWYYVQYMYGLRGGHLFGGGGLLEREFIPGNTVIA